MQGVLSTQVGYAGGTKKNPTYHDLGDQTEMIRIIYNPKIVSYKQILDIFWTNHDPTSSPWSKQYRSIIFYYNDEQKKLAFETKAHIEKELRRKVHTDIVPVSTFYGAEGYHQKYYLRNSPDVLGVFKESYPSESDFVASTAVARVNGYLGGYGKIAELENELLLTGLPRETIQKIVGFLGEKYRN